MNKALDVAFKLEHEATKMITNITKINSGLDTALDTISSIERFIPTGIYALPGPKYLKAGTMDSGYFGIICPDECFITGDDLCSMIDLTMGTAINNDTCWIKYAWKGKICYTPIKPIRRSISWNNIYNVGAVYGTDDEGAAPPNGRYGSNISINGVDNSINISGTENNFLITDYVTGAVGETLILKGFNNPANNGEVTITSISDYKIIVSGKALVTEATGNKNASVYNKKHCVMQDKKVTINGMIAKVRLMSTSDDYCMETTTWSTEVMGSEYNSIILTLHEKSHNGVAWNYPEYAQNVMSFNEDFTDQDFEMKGQNGSRRWSQNHRGDAYSCERMLRGYYATENVLSDASLILNIYRGLTPVLEFL
jgi:hypothetical protein